ncbi:MAG: hypothetical protein UU13_C0018G0010 [Candidatus Nomurabacteria bacterium GW2011_GWB1_40_7]|uniref:Uncharacterized protein n=1 Tax=Candidatus Nomurabacteria bacterium GW2011_GWB1_40_7 TaxID=1618744 RepID=A0A0G0SYR2_9BACT|nr:MAG: hypothetical protein UU13_C0018G0010 [Candidatus Nomurabacteria bacterium GW2011_GWB1_40_7]
MMIENEKRFVAIFIVVLIIGNVVFAYNYFTSHKELEIIKSSQTKVELNQKIINFASMFIKKVLQADKEVDFETRLSLENAVRDLKDEEVMAEWQNFTASKTEADAQNSVKKLLGILITKIQK